MRLSENAAIGSLVLANRLVKSATLENMATPEGLPTRDTLRFYERLARGGSGLIMTGYAYVHPSGRSYPLQHSASSDAMVGMWRPVTDKVHENGSRIALQIVHGGRQCRPVPKTGTSLFAPPGFPTSSISRCPGK